MNKSYWIVIGIIVVLILILGVFFVNIYKPFRLNYDPSDLNIDEQCITYYQKCTCIGNLIILETYPMQYKCYGLNFCKDINEVECR